ncbi:aldose epimerase [Corynebacterium sp. 3HC-13]|uniref:aldose 1-epimerase family protein n=1 Tax=Corynebacterium poyangense TaxID=2684405 RepID=UPI001CC9D563|nr:aldose 1-epimerase family protein [Corynebacterium poyangense]MBZ8178005.1 aldose epimerase [Corynebacterium poyangense]
MSSYLGLRAGDYEAKVSSFGGGPAELRFQGDDLLAPYGDNGFPPLGAQTLLAPWPNRIADGVFSHRGEMHRLDISEPGRMTAIHGFVGTRQWKVDTVEDTRVGLRLDLPAQPGWPWPLEYAVTWELNEKAGLSGVMTIRHPGIVDSDCPLGIGWHPYLVARGAALDVCILSVPAKSCLPLDPQRNLPAGPEIPADAVLTHLNHGVPMHGVWLDHCFGSVAAPAADGMIRATLVDREGRGVELRADAKTKWFQIFTADPARREGYPGLGRAVAVEPMTCPPNAFRSGRDIGYIKPGETVQFQVGVRALGE